MPCAATTKSGERCRRSALPDNDFCATHSSDGSGLDLPEGARVCEVAGVSGFWARVGTLSTCAAHVVAIAGISFPRTTYPLIGGSNGETPERGRSDGHVLFLSLDKYAQVLESARGKLQRWVGPQGQILNRSHVRFRPHATDEALANHVYIEAVEGPPTYTRAVLDKPAMSTI